MQHGVAHLQLLGDTLLQQGRKEGGERGEGGGGGCVVRAGVYLVVDEGTQHGLAHPHLLSHALLQHGGHNTGGGGAQCLVVGVANGAGRGLGVQGAGYTTASDGGHGKVVLCSGGSNGAEAPLLQLRGAVVEAEHTEAVGEELGLGRHVEQGPGGE